MIGVRLRSFRWNFRVKVNTMYSLLNKQGDPVFSFTSLEIWGFYYCCVVKLLVEKMRKYNVLQITKVKRIVCYIKTWQLMAFLLLFNVKRVNKEPARNCHINWKNLRFLITKGVFFTCAQQYISIVLCLL